MTKAEVYKMVIDMQLKHGQGLTGIVKIGNDPTVAGHLDDLVEEGLLEIFESSGTLGHPFSNQFYIPTKGYNVWKDGVENGNSKSVLGSENYFLNNVRFYLDSLEEHDGTESEIVKAINPSRVMLIRDPHFMEGYAKWLKRNKEELEIMLNLDPIYVGKGIEFTEEEKDFIKSRPWFKENKTVKECLNLSLEVISLNNQLIDLYRKRGNSEKEIEEVESKIKKYESEIEFRKKLNRWFNEQDMNVKIQDVFNKEKEAI
jgi:hypothetical protein